VLGSIEPLPRSKLVEDAGEAEPELLLKLSMKLLIATTWGDEDVGCVGRRTTRRRHIEVPTREPRTYEEDEEEDEEDARPPTPVVMSSVMSV
jgi:hypothetical protein